jgi:hypothetical protein
MTIKGQLKQLESRLQTLIESYASRIITSKDLTDHLIHKLVEAMGEKHRREDDRIIAPNFYTLHLPPGLATELRNNPVLVATLAHAIEKAGTETGFTFPSTPNITIIEDHDLSPEEVYTEAKIHLGPLESTKSLEEKAENASVIIPANAFLIVNGNQVFPLTQPVLNIGRRIDNNLVIDDPSVSRVHAQLRAIDEHFVIFDLASTGGTFVNGQRVAKSVLYPGDVVSLSGAQLVYGQDAPRPLDEAPGYTKPMPVDQKKTVTSRNPNKSSNRPQ